MARVFKNVSNFLSNSKLHSFKFSFAHWKEKLIFLALYDQFQFPLPTICTSGHPEVFYKKGVV